MESLLNEIRACQVCKDSLPHSPRPIISASENSKIVVIGQAPGAKVHESGVPWDDASGRRLRSWMGLSDEQFYNPELVALLPMGFCYPGKGASGDLPPRPECAPLWHQPVLNSLSNPELILLVGSYAQNYYLSERSQNTLTETVMNFREYLPEYFPLPHPSPRNNIWLRNNPWFEKNVLPELRMRVSDAK